MKDISNCFTLAGTEIVKIPLELVTVPRFVPGMLMDAPTSGALLSDVTVPVMVRFWACTKCTSILRLSTSRNFLMVSVLVY